MKPSEKAIEELLADLIWENDRSVKQALKNTENQTVANPTMGALWETCFGTIIRKHVDPLLAAKDAEIRVNNALVDDLKDMATEKDEEIKRFRQQWFEEKELYDDVFDKWQAGLNRISELEAEIERLNLHLKHWEDGHNAYLFNVRITELEAALRQQKDECERFHKPA